MKFYFTFLLFFTLSLFSADPQDFPVDPLYLKPHWFEFFEQDSEADANFSKFIQFAEAAISKFTEEKKEEASQLLAKIKTNYKNFIALKNQKPTPLPQSQPLAAAYTFDEAMELIRNKRMHASELKSLRNDYNDALNKLVNLQNEVDKLVQNYFKMEERSEDKFIEGLKIINLQLELAGKKQEVQNFKFLIQGHERYDKSLNEEVETALSRLESTSDESINGEKSAASDKAKQLEKQYADMEERLNRTGNQPADLYDPSASLEEQNLLKAFLEMESQKQSALFLQIKSAYLNLADPHSPSDLIELNREVRTWEKELTAMQQRLDEAKEQVERQIQRYGQLLILDSSGEITFAPNKEEQTVRTGQNNLLAIQKLKNEITDSLYLLKVMGQNIAMQLGGSKKLGVQIGHFFSSFKGKIASFLEAPLFHYGIIPITLLSLLKVVGIILLTAVLAKWFFNWLTKFAVSKKNVDRSLLYRITRLLYYAVLFIGTMFALSTIGFEFANFLLVAGALGVGLGFGLQSIFNNFVSGIIMLFETNLKVGDFVELASGIKGEIREINVRSTLITMNNGTEVIVPNSEMVSSTVINWTLKHPYRRVTIPFNVAYGTDKELVSKIIKEEALKLPATLIKPGFSDPSVILTGMSDRGLEFEMSAWVNEKSNKMPGKTTSDYLWMIDSTLKEHNIEIPYQHLDIRVQ